MAGKKHGKDSHLGLEDAGGVLRIISDHCDSITQDRDWDMADSTTMGLEDKTFVPGLGGATLVLAGKWDSLAGTGPDVVLNSLAGIEVSASFEYGPEGNAAAAVKYSGEAFLSKYQVSSPLEGVVKFSATLQVTGPVARGAFA